MHDDLATAIDALLPALREDLEALIRIPSISAPSYDPAPVRRSAEATADLMRAAGLDDVQILEHGDAHPAVYGEKRGPEGSPTVLLYAHHDVQPAGDMDAWDRDPFEPVEIDGRLYGRGSSDDKAGILLHLGVVQAFGDDLPVTVKVFVEGEEEIGSAHLTGFLDDHAERLRSDVIVIADSANWRVGVPALTTSLRGLVSVDVEVEVLDAAIHSGQFGGAVPDALTVLCRVIAGLHDERGNVTVPGIATGDADPLDLTEDELRSQAGVKPGVDLIGEGPLTTRLWQQPALAVLAIDAPPMAEAVNALVPKARAKVSMRIPPGEAAADAMEKLIAHIESQPAWGATVTATANETGEAFELGSHDPRVEAFRSAFAEAYDTETVDIGVGGSIPFVAAFAERNPDAAILLTGVGDPTSRAHGPNESLSLDDFRSGILGEAIALRNLRP
jgi:acetylornithine deacetylase/succinyl-diaminopimelate desuccinylase-like protein